MIRKFSQQNSDSCNSAAKIYATILLSLTEQLRGLVKALKILQKNDVNLNHIEFRPSKEVPGEYDFLIVTDQPQGFKNAVSDLKCLTRPVRA